MTLAETFDRDGFVVVEDVFSVAELDVMKKEIEEIVEQMNIEEHPKNFFITYDQEKHVKDDYFLTSSDKIRFFYEEGAFGEDGQLKVPKGKSINKIGHGLHHLNPVFKKMTNHPKIQEVFRQIGYQDPRVVQSMYIFKQPRIGGEVTDHVDATYLKVDPVENLTGVWVAVDDATLTNGCLHFIPGSHKDTSLDYYNVRTHDTSGGPLLKYIGKKPVYSQDKFVPVPIRKGSLILIHGLVVHKSDANRSESSRHAYTVHVMEGAQTTWSPDNWLQETPTYKFPPLYTQ